ncbi:MAG: hypothetical protein JNL38_41440, partial [Myxococcales bacterium]|nr:hypothetical protein [Myxococcales bacterium]
AIGGATGAVLRVRASEPAMAAPAPCLRGADVVGVVWDGAARARLHDARPKNVGTAQWGAVEAALDAQAAAWAAAYDDSCRASMARTLTGDARARRDFCLQRRLDELALQALEPKRTHRSLSGRAGLGRVDECTDDATLARLPLPADAAGRARVLDGYRALYTDRLSATDAITRAAYPPLTVEDMAKGTAGGQDWLALQRAAASSGDDDLATRIDVAIVPRRRTLEGDFGDLEPAARARLQRMRRKDLAASLDAALADEALEGGDYEAARAAAARALEEVHPDHVLARTDRVAAAFALAEASLELGSADAVEAALRRLERESIRGLGGERGLERALRGRAALMRTPDTSSADLRAVLDTLSTRSEDAFERRARALAVLGLARAMAAGLDGAAADPRQAARLLRAEDERLSAEGVNLAAVLHGRIVLARVEIERPAPAAAAPDLYRACNLLGVGGSAPPDRVRCIVMLARAEAALGKQALALEHLELLVSLAPRSTPVARVEAATALLDATRRTRAASPAMLARATAFATETVAAVPPATPGLDALRAMLGKG